jgi:tol-pal system protein YbgF
VFCSAASTGLAQDQPVGEGLDKRLDRLEKQLREVRDIVLQAHATGAPIEIKEAGPDPQVQALSSRLDEMDQNLRGITGQIETLQHDLVSVRADAANANTGLAALTARLDTLARQAASLNPPTPGGAVQLGGGGLAGQAGQGPGPQAAAAPVDPKAAYDNAHRLLLEGDYAAAAAAFQDFVAQFPDSPSVRPARYWLGETKFIQGDYAGAAAAYIEATRGWQETDWAPDAVVKLALSLTELNKAKPACAALAELDRHYPHAKPATKTRADAARRKASCVT